MIVTLPATTGPAPTFVVPSSTVTEPVGSNAPATPVMVAVKLVLPPGLIAVVLAETVVPLAAGAITVGAAAPVDVI